MMIKNSTLIIIITLLTFIYSKVAANVKVSLKIDGNIITNYDIKREASYLKVLNNNLENLDNKKILEIAQESIIKETIKKLELSKYYILDQSNPLLDQVVKSFYTKLNLKNEKEFSEYLKKYGFNIIDIKKKIEIETTWNDLVTRNYQNQIKIDKKKLIKKIDNLTKDEIVKSYLLYEIVFEKKTGESIEDLNNRIKESIKEIGFKNTATIFSVSDTSKFGGKIGWVKEENLSSKLKNELKNIKINNYSKPIFLNNNFIILKIENIKNEIIKKDKKLLLKNMMKYEMQKQLNTFSKIHFNKIKIDTVINEF